MGITAALAALAAFGLAAPPGAQSFAGPLLALLVAAPALATAASAEGRATLAEAVSRNPGPVLLFIGLLGWLALRPQGAADPAAAWALGEPELIALAALGLAAVTTAGAALRQGTGAAARVFLAAGAATGVALLFLATLSGAPVSGAGLAGFVVLAVFVSLETLRRADRTAADAAQGAPLSRRMFVPAGAFLACAAGLAAAQDGSALLSAMAGVCALLAVYAWRLRAGQRQPSLVVAAGFLVCLGALFGVVRLIAPPEALEAGAAAGTALALWREAAMHGLGLGALAREAFAADAPAAYRLLAETGWIGAGLAAAAALSGVVALAATPDRERLPSRGGALATGLTVCAGVSALSSSALAQPEQAFAFACLFGLSGVYGASTRRVTGRGRGPARPAMVGTQHL